MKNRVSLNIFLNRGRNNLYIVLSIVIIFVLTLTVVYASLSTSLNINGQAEVTAANWDIYLDNVQVVGGSVTTSTPIITDKTTATFSTTLSKPGDYYMFTIDVVNNGSIDAMIDGVTKTPTLTETQAKYLNYVVEYQNGESINTKQLVTKNSYVRLKVKVEFRRDISVSDLPKQSETLNLSFKVNYVQSDDNSENITIDNNGKLIKIVSGDYNTVGSEICIGEECFYVISSDEDSVTMLAKYNLYVGGSWNGSIWTPYGNEATGTQSPMMLGWTSSLFLWDGIIPFSSINYWYNGSSLNGEYGTNYPAYVYDSNSILYNYVENYKTYLESQGFEIEEARLITYVELISLGCSGNRCSAAPEWVCGTSYWSGTAYANLNVFSVRSTGELIAPSNDYNREFGVRPVIVIKV